MHACVRACVVVPLPVAYVALGAKGEVIKTIKYDFTAYRGKNNAVTWTALLQEMIAWHAWLQRSMPGLCPSSYCPPHLPPRPEKHCPGLTTMWSTFSRQRIPAGLIPPFFQPSPSDRWDQKWEKKSLKTKKLVPFIWIQCSSTHRGGLAGVAEDLQPFSIILPLIVSKIREHRGAAQSSRIIPTFLTHCLYCFTQHKSCTPW